MILAALNDYYQHLDAKGLLPTYGFSEEKISFAIVLSTQGEVVAVDDIRDASGKKPRPKPLSVPQPSKRTVNIAPCFLWDKTSYVLGVTAKTDGKALDRLPKEHEAFKNTVLTAVQNSNDVGLCALSHFLKHWSPSDFQPPLFKEEILDTNVVFRLDGEQQYLHDRPAAKAIYLEYLAKAEKKQATCLVTGETAPIARLHPSIKGVKDAQSSGASILSFNLDSFTSYGKSQGDNAPVSEKVAFAYTSVLNHLLRQGEDNFQRLQIGDTTVVFWATAKNTEAIEQAEQTVGFMLNPPSTDEQETGKLQEVLKVVRDGRPMQTLNPDFDEGTRIFVLGLAPNNSRLSIRFWQADSLDVFAQRLAEHYEDLEFQPLPWKTPPAIWRLLYATAPSRGGKAKAEDIPPQLAGELTRSILAGTTYPRNLLATILMRMRADGEITGIRAALCKAVLVREQRLRLTSSKEDIPVSKDETIKNQGYRLGMLFAELENAQKQALGKEINATIADRYYGAASATPASVFPMLLRNSKNHLAKLRKSGNEKDKRAAIGIEKKIGEILNEEYFGREFHKHLTMEDQGRFAIGYYQQRYASSNHSPDTQPETAGEKS